MTTITDNRNNGTIAELLELLNTHPLARRLTWADAPEEWAFIERNHIGVGAGYPTEKGRCYPASDTQLYTGMTVFSGNFFTWSWTFHVATDEAELIETLTAAIRKNMQRPDYLAQDKPTSVMGQHYILLADGSELHWKHGEYV